MRLPYKIHQAYERLVEAFGEVVVSANGGTVKSLPVSECFKPQSKCTVYENYMHLANWNFRPGKTNEKLSILLKVEETVDNAPLSVDPPRYDVSKSTVWVSYYEAGFKKLLQSIHFDFEGPKQSHPIFHAQFTHEGIPLPDGIPEQLGVALPAETDSIPNCKSVRIPTADMTLSSVLLCLIVDHIKSDFVSTFLTELDKLEDRLPLPRCDQILDSIDGLTRDHRNLRSKHWFAHMKVGN